jgi:uncharacterized repeat protein (TIGR01451 family)
VPDVGHHFVQWSDGSNANPRTDEDIVADVGVDALFAADTFVVTASASANGTIAPAQQTIAYGDHAVFTVEPDAGYGATLTGDTCDVAQTDASSWTTGPITVPCTVSATFALLPMAVLAINVTDERDFAAYGATLQYVVTVSNTGDAVATAVAVSNASPAQIDAGATTWTCTGAGSGAECQASGTGALETAGVVIPPGRTLVWHVTAPVLQGAGGASIDYAVSAGIGAGTPIEATDVDILVLLRNGFEAE